MAVPLPVLGSGSVSLAAVSALRGVTAEFRGRGKLNTTLNEKTLQKQHPLPLLLAHRHSLGGEEFVVGFVVYALGHQPSLNLMFVVAHLAPQPVAAELSRLGDLPDPPLRHSGHCGNLLRCHEIVDVRLHNNRKLSFVYS